MLSQNAAPVNTFGSMAFGRAVPLKISLLSAGRSLRRKDEIAVREDGPTVGVDAADVDEHVDVIMGLLRIEAGLLVDAVLLAQREMQAALAFEGRDVIEHAVLAHGRVEPDAELADEHLLFRADLVEHRLERLRTVVRDDGAALDADLERGMDLHDMVDTGEGEEHRFAVHAGEVPRLAEH